MNYNKLNFDRQAERESNALRKAGRQTKDKRVVQEMSDYNKEKFDKLFKD